MTTVAAIARDGHVWMAADSCNNVYDRPIPGGAQKIFRAQVGDKEALIGICGNGALGAIVRDRLDLTAGLDRDNTQQWADTVASAITEVAVERGVTQDGQLDGTLILGCAGRLWTLVHHQAIPHPDGIAAVGSGEGPAIGAIDALLAIGEPPETAVTRAVEIAIARDRYSAGPIFTAYWKRASTPTPHRASEAGEPRHAKVPPASLARLRTGTTGWSGNGCPRSGHARRRAAAITRSDPTTCSRAEREAE